MVRNPYFADLPCRPRVHLRIQGAEQFAVWGFVVYS